MIGNGGKKIVMKNSMNTVEAETTTMIDMKKNVIENVMIVEMGGGAAKKDAMTTMMIIAEKDGKRKATGCGNN